MNSVKAIFLQSYNFKLFQAYFSPAMITFVTPQLAVLVEVLRIKQQLNK